MNAEPSRPGPAERGLGALDARVLLFAVVLVQLALLLALGALLLQRERACQELAAGAARRAPVPTTPELSGPSPEAPEAP